MTMGSWAYWRRRIAIHVRRKSFTTATRGQKLQILVVINSLSAELWEGCFSATEIAAEFKDAATDMSRYAAGDEVLP
jgi:hypothetical protein